GVEAGIPDPPGFLNMPGLMGILHPIPPHAEAVCDLSNAVKRVSHVCLLLVHPATRMYAGRLDFSGSSGFRCEAPDFWGFPCCGVLGSVSGGGRDAPGFGHRFAGLNHWVSLPWLRFPSISTCPRTSPLPPITASATATGLKSLGPYPSAVAVTAAAARTRLTWSSATGCKSSATWTSAASPASGLISRPSTAARGVTTA